MTAGDRFKGWIDSLATAWGARLGGWMLGWLASGLKKTLGDVAPSADVIDQLLATYKARTGTSSDLADFIAWLRSMENTPIGWLLGVVLFVIQTVGLALSGSSSMANEIRHAQERVLRTARLDPLSVITAWRRDPSLYERYFEDLRVQGWSDDRIEALKFVTLFYPNPADLVRWQAREVFEPEMVSKYGLDDELGGIQRDPFYKAGMTDEQITNYWRAHWEHASWNQVVEMVRRGQMTEQDVWDWFRLVEIPPFWRQKLINISWEVPTRVDVRRFYDLRTIDEVRLRELYTAQGYHGKDLDDYVLWTKIYVEFPDLLARWKNGWITLENVRSRLTQLGMSPAAAEELIQTKVQAEGATRTTAERELTKADIYKGVKEERLTRLEGLELLMDLGYDENEASYILDIYAPTDETVSAVQQRQLTKADVLAGLKADIITEQGSRTMLLELRYSAIDVEFLIKLFKATVTPPTELKLKEASKADVVLGVTRGLITPQEGHAMLLDIGYSPEAADFILMVKAAESPFSPITYAEFKDQTQRWRQAAGVGGKPMPEELKKLAAQVVKLEAEWQALNRAVKQEEGRLVQLEDLPETATARLKELQVARNRAAAELERVRTDYNARIAEWKHGAK